jgi:hypothetical protein
MCREAARTLDDLGADELTRRGIGEQPGGEAMPRESSAVTCVVAPLRRPADKDSAARQDRQRRQIRRLPYNGEQQ